MADVQLADGADPNAPSLTETDHLQLATSLERASEHLFAVVIVRGRTTGNSRSLPVTDFRSVIADGVAGRVHDRTVLIDKPKILEAEKITLPGSLTARATGQPVEC